MEFWTDDSGGPLSGALRSLLGWTEGLGAEGMAIVAVVALLLVVALVSLHRLGRGSRPRLQGEPSRLQHGDELKRNIERMRKEAPFARFPKRKG